MAVLLTTHSSSIRDCVRQVLDTFAERLDPNQGFFLKPNVVFPVPPTHGEITRPGLVQAVVEVLREQVPNADIVIGEGTAAGTNPEQNFRVSGYTALAKQLQVPLINLDDAERVEVPSPLGPLALPRMALERNYLNLAILKPSSAAGISGAMKNQKGLITPGLKKRFHRLGLDQPLVQLNQAIQPQLSMVDGWNFFVPEFFFAGDHTVEIDTIICQTLGIEPVEHVRLARAAGLGAASVEIIGKAAKAHRNARTLRPKAFKSMGALRLWSNPGACSMCRFLFQQLRQNPFSPLPMLTGLKLLPYAAFGGADIVFGSNPRFERTKRKVICVGNCTKTLAEKEGWIFIPGCPPTLRDLKDGL